MLTKDERLLVANKILRRLHEIATEGDEPFDGVTLDADSSIWSALCDLALEFDIRLPLKGQTRVDLRKLLRTGGVHKAVRP